MKINLIKKNIDLFLGQRISLSRMCINKPKPGLRLCPAGWQMVEMNCFYAETVN